MVKVSASQSEGRGFDPRLGLFGTNLLQNSYGFLNVQLQLIKEFLNYEMNYGNMHLDAEVKVRYGMRVTIELR